MKNPSHRDRLIASLPADLQAGAMEACHNISEDGNDPVVGMFATDIESTQRGFADQRENTERSTAQLQEEIRSLRAKLAESEEREKQLPALISKGQAETQKTVQHELGKLGQDQFWKRVVRSKIAGGITFAVCWVVGSYLLINTQIGAVKTSVDQLKADQVATLETISKKPQGIVDFTNASLKAADKSNDTAAMLAGISAMLSIPDATIGMREGKLIIKIESKHIEIKQEGDHTKLQIHQKLPTVLDRIEDHLDEADAAFQE